MQTNNSETAGMTPLNVLIVDDSATMRALLYRVVGLADLPIGAIYQAPNGAEALKVLETHSIQAVFTDVNMPVMNGMELIRAIRDDPRFAMLPVVVQTSDRAAARAPVWTDLHVAQTVIKSDFMEWLVAHIEEHIASGDGPT